MGHHVICKSDLAVFVANDGEGHCNASNLTDIVDPSAVGLDGICGESDQFHPTLRKLRLILRQSRKLSGAYRGIILGMREENGPFVTNPLMKVDEAQCRLSLEIWGP